MALLKSIAAIIDQTFSLRNTPADPATRACLWPRDRFLTRKSATGRIRPRMRRLQSGVDILVATPGRLLDHAGQGTVDLSRVEVLVLDKARKRELLSHLIGSNRWEQVLVFSRTKHGANRLAKQLEADGLGAAAIHGNKSQGARTRALADFKAGRIRVLVATDIAARGLDIEQLPHVVNFDLPNVPEDYVHRIGRTGRAGLHGEALSLVSADERGLLRDIERLVGLDLTPEVLEG